MGDVAVHAILHRAPSEPIFKPAIVDRTGRMVGEQCAVSVPVIDRHHLLLYRPGWSVLRQNLEEAGVQTVGSVDRPEVAVLIVPAAVKATIICRVTPVGPSPYVGPEANVPDLFCPGSAFELRRRHPMNANDRAAATTAGPAVSSGSSRSSCAGAACSS